MSQAEPRSPLRFLLSPILLHGRYRGKQLFDLLGVLGVACDVLHNRGSLTGSQTRHEFVCQLLHGIAF